MDLSCWIRLGLKSQTAKERRELRTSAALGVILNDILDGSIGSSTSSNTAADGPRTSVVSFADETRIPGGGVSVEGPCSLYNAVAYKREDEKPLVACISARDVAASNPRFIVTDDPCGGAA